MSRVVIFQHDDRCAPGRLGRALESAGCRLEVIRPDRDGADAVPRGLDGVGGVVSLGGPMNIADGLGWLDAEMVFLRRAHEASVPLVGICLGHQAIAAALGGRVEAMDRPEIGFLPIERSPGAEDGGAFVVVPDGVRSFCSHGFEVVEPPPGAVVLAGSAMCRVQAFRVGCRTYGFQYHFEWEHAQIIHEDEAFLRRAGLTREDLEAQSRVYYAGFDQAATGQCRALTGMFGCPVPGGAGRSPG